MVFKCNCCGEEINEEEFEIVQERLDGFVVDEYYDTSCRCCGGEFESTIECEDCGELVAVSNAYDGMCEDCYLKNKYLKMIKDFKSAQEIIEEINNEVDICNNLDRLVIYRKKDFENICEILKLKYIVKNVDELDSLILSTEYDGLEIEFVIRPQEYEKEKNIKKYCKKD